MNKFETPTLDVEKLTIAEVIATSTCPDDCGSYVECLNESGGWSL